MQEQIDKSVSIGKSGTYVLLTLTAIFWGSAFVFSKVAENSAPPVVAAFFRFGLGAILGVVMILVQKARNPNFVAIPKTAWKDTIILGLVGVTGYNLFFFGGLSLSQSSDGSMIIPTLSPAITIILAGLFLKERFRKNQTIGLFITLIGAMIFFSAIVFLRTPSGMHRMIGDGMFLASAVLWAINTLLSKRITSRVDPFLVMTYAMVFGSIVLGAIAFPQLIHLNWSSLSWGFWVNEGYLALFSSVLANWFYYLGVHRIGPSRASVFMYFVPVSALIIAGFVLGESLTMTQLLGAALMMVGVWQINRKSRFKAVEAENSMSID